MKKPLFSYNKADTPIHSMSGITKLLGFLLLTFGVMFSYDIRVVLCVMIFSFAMLKVADIKLRQIRLMIIYVAVFLAFNFVATYIFAPEYGVEIYGTKHVIMEIWGRYSITQEQLLYQFTKFLKYCSVIPLGMIFLLTTNPSEFASALNGIKVNYKAAYAVALTLRYFPDMQRDYTNISQAQQARGLEMSSKAKLSSRFKNALLIIMPLIFSSLGRIDSISNAMDLRGFGKYKKRTWYSKKPLMKADKIALAVCIGIFLGTVAVSIFVNGSRFWNPFV
ncbi:MAG: energy-coupling factor transporter transmembrane component T family protein [Anaerovoracaceae bacterium]